MSKTAEIQIGATFNDLTVIGAAAKRKTHYYYPCQCVCGKKTVVRKDRLLKGLTVSCGCNRRPNLTGQQFGRLKVIELDHIDKSNAQYWRCQCKCGGEIVANTRNLRNGHVTSCGCYHDEVSKTAGKKLVNHADNHRRKDGTDLAYIASDKIPKDNTSGVKGVSLDRKTGKWRAQIQIAKKPIFLGKFEKLEDAAAARKDAEEKYFKPILEKYNKK